MLLCLRMDSLAVNDSIPDFNFEEFSYSGKSLDISERTNQNARANKWHPDGTMLFLAARRSENVLAYETNTPWEIEGARLVGELDLSGEPGSSELPLGSHTHGLYFREDDGKKMWILNRREIWAYTLSTPWDITTAEQTNYAALDDKVSTGHDFTFKPDGTVLYVDDRANQKIFAYRLSIPWDVSTAAFKSELDISAEEDRVRGIEFIHDGQVMILLDTNRNSGEVLQYHLSDPWDITTAVFIDAFNVSGEVFNARGISISKDLQSMYITCRKQEKILQYDRGAPAMVYQSAYEPSWDFGTPPLVDQITEMKRFLATSYSDPNEWSIGFESGDGGFFRVNPGNRGESDEHFGFFINMSDLGNGTLNPFKVEAILGHDGVSDEKQYGIYALVEEPSEFVENISKNSEGLFFGNLGPGHWYHITLAGTYTAGGDLHLQLRKSKWSRGIEKQTKPDDTNAEIYELQIVLDTDDPDYSDGAWFGFGGRHSDGEYLQVHSFRVTDGL